MKVVPEEIITKNTNIDTKKLKEDFLAAWPRLLKELMDDNEFQDIRESMKWLENVLRQNVPFGKQNRAMAGMTVYYEMMQAQGKIMNAEDDYLCFISGWCAEIMQAAALIADDIMDESRERRNRPCWYLNNGVGMTAINDAFLLENVVYHIMWKYFEGEEYFTKLMKLLQTTGFKTILGQSLDTRVGIEHDFSKFTMENYQAIVKYKTSLYTFYSPIAVAMIRAGVAEEAYFDQVRQLALEMGYFFQVQDDFLDCYGDSEETGKIGTDITDGKCTWLVVTALESCQTEEQRMKLQASYGLKDIHEELHVKEMYDKLKIDQKFRKHEDTVYRSILDKINNLPEVIPKNPLFQLINGLYKRNK